MRTIHVSILGCCSTRDTLEVLKQSEDIKGNSDVVVDKYVENLSPLSVFADPFSDEDYSTVMEESAKSTASRFQHRKIEQEMKKNHFSFFQEAQSDYFIIDTSAIRLPVFKVGNSFISCEVVWQITKRISDFKEKDYFLKRILASDKYYPSELGEEELRSLFHRYFDCVLKMYDQKKIIFVNLKNASVFISANGDLNQELALERNNVREDDLMDFVFSLAKEYCPKSFFIEKPPITVGDMNHWFGQHSLHFVRNVYRYYAESLMAVFKGRGKKDAESEMERLKHQYTARLFADLCDAANRYVVKTTNILVGGHYPKPGMYALCGITLKTYADYRFELQGQAVDQAILYLYSGSGNPIGDWSPATIAVGPGSYMLKTGFSSDSHAHIDVVFYNDSSDKKWVWGNKSVQIELAKPYKYFLARVVVEKDAVVDQGGVNLVGKSELTAFSDQLLLPLSIKPSA